MNQLNGQWKNNFGSIVNMFVDPDTGIILGTYGSDTGSSGTYYVVGHASTQMPTGTNGLNLAICVFWRPINPETPDPSWHWSTTQSGQLLQDGTMQLFQSMEATTDFSAIEAKKGNYIEKLLYTQQQPTPDPKDKPELPTASDKTLDNPLNGNWESTNAELSMNFVVKEMKDGWVLGNMTNLATGQTIPLLGFTDIRTDGIELQSLCLSGYDPITNNIITFNGSLNTQSSVITLSQWTTQSTKPEDGYVQTAISQVMLSPA